MQFTRLAIPDVVLLTPKVFDDERGFFMETFRQNEFEQHCGHFQFVQDNHSRSGKGILRGLHYQYKYPQGKLVRVSRGEVFDVVVDMRKNSPTFGQWVAAVLSAENKRQLWVPEGFAHGFVVTTDSALFHYGCTAPYDKAADANLRWNDARLAIDWPIGSPSLSDKDERAPFLDDIAEDRLPVYST